MKLQMLYRMRNKIIQITEMIKVSCQYLLSTHVPEIILRILYTRDGGA